MCSKEWDEDTINLLEEELNAIERILKNSLTNLEKVIPAQEDEEDGGGEKLPREPPRGPPLLQTTTRIVAALKRCVRAEDAVLQENKELKKRYKEQRFLLEEVEMERDVLLQQVHAYLETNSSLRVRLEEQRCQTGTLQGQQKADLELRLKMLETEKERLSDLTLEKDKKIHKMSLLLEQTTRNLRMREAEALDRKAEESSLVAALKADLQKALKEKEEVQAMCSILRKRLYGELPNLKRSLSTGDVEGNPPLDFLRGPFEESSVVEDPFKAPLRRFDDSPSSPPRCSRLPPKSPPVHTQLNSLKRDLVNVTRKLDALKCQLDAKNLNAKLENLREEKQRMIDMRRGVKKEGEAGCWRFQDAVAKLREAVKDCEEQLDEGVISKAEALAGLVPPFFSCVLTNLECFHDWRKRSGCGESRRNSNESTGGAPPLGEDGGGDNLLRGQISPEDLKPQIARPKVKVDHLEKV